jgi:hypothetical protein
MNDGRTQDGYGARFEQLQARFIDEPGAAVEEAGSLVREAVDGVLSGEHDTERMRRLMQGYRDLLTRLEGREEEPAAAVPSSRERGEGETASTAAEVIDT